MDIGFIYMWENTLNSKKYIGSHKGNITDNYIGSGVYFKRSYNKNKEFFKRTILYIGKNYRLYEEKILTKLNVAYSQEYYNLKNQAIGGWDHTNNNIEIIKKRNESISKSKKGKYFSYLKYDKNGINNPMYGKTHSIDTLKKISDKRKLNNTPRANKKIIEYNSNLIFDSITECALYHNVKQSTMSYLIKKEIIIQGKCKGKKFGYV
jgi:hypothetical protein